MVVGDNELASTWVNSTGNSPFSVKIRDTGAIATYTGAGFKYLDGTGTPQAYMGTKMQAKLGTHPYVEITTTDQEIYSGVPGVFSGKINYKQTVLVTDRIATGISDKYWTKVTVTGQAV